MISTSIFPQESDAKIVELMCARLHPNLEAVQDRRREPVHFTPESWRKLCDDKATRAEAGKLLGKRVLVIHDHDQYMKDKAQSDPKGQYLNPDVPTLRMVLKEHYIQPYVPRQVNCEFFILICLGSVN